MEEKQLVLISTLRKWQSSAVETICHRVWICLHRGIRWEHYVAICWVPYNIMRLCFLSICNALLWRLTFYSRLLNRHHCLMLRQYKYSRGDFKKRLSAYVICFSDLIMTVCPKVIRNALHVNGFEIHKYYYLFF